MPFVSLSASIVVVRVVQPSCRPDFPIGTGRHLNLSGQRKLSTDSDQTNIGMTGSLTFPTPLNGVRGESYKPHSTKF